MREFEDQPIYGRRRKPNFHEPDGCSLPFLAAKQERAQNVHPVLMHILSTFFDPARLAGARIKFGDELIQAQQLEHKADNHDESDNINDGVHDYSLARLKSVRTS